MRAERGMLNGMQGSGGKSIFGKSIFGKSIFGKSIFWQVYVLASLFLASLFLATVLGARRRPNAEGAEIGIGEGGNRRKKESRGRGRFACRPRSIQIGTDPRCSPSACSEIV